MTTGQIVLPSRPETEHPFDMTIVACLRDGRHLLYQAQVQLGDNPALLAAAHCNVRKFRNGDIVRFVVVTAAGDVESLEAGRG